MILLPLAILEYRGAPPAGRDALAFFGTAVLILAPLCILLAVTLVKERPTAPAPRINLLEGLGAVVKNPHMRRLLVADAMASMPGAVMAGLFIFYQAELIGNAQFNSLALIAFYTAHILGVPVWVRTAYRIGKHRTFALASLGFCLTTGMFFFPGEGQVALFIAFLFATGFMHSGLQFLIRAMAADVIDYDNVQTGGQRSGLYFALLAITAKMGGALAIGLTYPLLDQVGFNAQGGNSEDTLFAFRIIYVAVPTLAMLGAYFGIRGFHLDQDAQADLRSEIEARDARTADGHPTDGRKL
jgi:Na+/melibiose symporter-like transporter